MIVLLVAGVATIIYLEASPMYLFGLFAIVGTMMLVVVKRLKGPHDFDRLRENPVRHFQVHSNSIVLTDNVFRSNKNRRSWKVFTVPNGRYRIELKLDSEYSAITGFRLSGPEGADFTNIRWTFECGESFIFVLDGSSATDQQSLGRLKDVIGSRLPTPVFEEIRQGENVFGVIVDRGDQGNYDVRSLGGELVCEFLGRA